MYPDYSAIADTTIVAVASTPATMPTATTCTVTTTTLATVINSTRTTDSSAAPSTPVASPPSPSLLPSPSLESRIPRLSPTVLRRTGSLRMRNDEQVPPHQQPCPTATLLLGHQHHRRHNLLQSQRQDRQLPDRRFYDIITENGTDSPRQRSFSLSLTPVRPRPGHAASGGTTTGAGVDDSDVESVKSYSSACSTASACEHATFALNGTTWSGRSRRYVVHCTNRNSDNEQYLTPTQRAGKEVRKLQTLLKEARKEVQEKDQEILRLTKEVVELRLYKASLNSPEERTDSSDAITVRENNPFSPESPGKDIPDEATVGKTTTGPETPEKHVHTDLPSSLADSGHFEDSSVHSKDSVCLPESQPEIVASTSANVASDHVVSDTVSILPTSTERDEERRQLVNHYENRIEDMHRRHIDELQELKQKHNDKVESLLNQLSENNTLFCEMRPAVDTAEARAHELETELETVKTELNEHKKLLSEQEERNKQMYLKMYAKGQEAARFEQADQILMKAHQSPPKVTVAELLQQLTTTQAELENVKDTNYSPVSPACIPAERLLSAQEAVSLWVLGARKAMYRRIVEARSNQGTLDPEILLQFLKSAIYYFLTDKENYHGHLSAIESILGFTDAEKRNIDKIHGSAKKYTVRYLKDLCKLD